MDNTDRDRNKLGVKEPKSPQTTEKTRTVNDENENPEFTGSPDLAKDAEQEVLEEQEQKFREEESSQERQLFEDREAALAVAATVPINNTQDSMNEESNNSETQHSQDQKSSLPFSLETIPERQAAEDRVSQESSAASSNHNVSAGKEESKKSDFTSGDFGIVDTRTLEYVDRYIDDLRDKTITETNLDITKLPKFQKKYIGKVRDMYICEEMVIIITTDRQSAFDRQLASVPCKGQVLNLASLWWFQQSQRLVPNHVISSPHPNVLIAKRCSVFPVEFVMRGYITGTTSTSLWTNYNKGIRDYCGHIFPEGLKKNQKLQQNVLTPTTKSDEHDLPISGKEIVKQGLMTLEDWEICSHYAYTLFSFGQETAKKNGLILVDTKYEFGKDDKTGEILIIDEIHTPDSSRYWIAETYEKRMEANEVRECHEFLPFLLIFLTHMRDLICLCAI
jgi:phosphoribosylaminoimidazole-succinocarboxamide synthase